ncbi:MAG: TIGR03936 family radical SAM-associated protein [Clostridiales bacterium]|nr:TIGR03936 family radical SAM-associated protein [Clostridiales bacterium]
MEEVFVLKARIKFRKYGVMKFIGHLDIMRFFQKVMRRADIPIAFTGGYSPHMIMSFANPLGVGLTSDGEYFDIELTEPIDFDAAVERMNATMVEGIEVVNMVEISDDKKRTGMSIVAAADYLSFAKNHAFPDIKPMIYQFEARDEEIYMQVATGSVENLKPELVMQAFSQFLGLNAEEITFVHHRLEVYANIGTEDNRELVSLDQVS